MDTEPIYCAEQIAIPENLGEILKAYSKEVIRQNPQNVYEFSARYFEQLCQGWEDNIVIETRDLAVVFEQLQALGKDEATFEEFQTACDVAQVPPECVDQVRQLGEFPDDAATTDWREFVVLMATQVAQDRDSLVEVLFELFAEEGKLSADVFLTLFQFIVKFDRTVTQDLIEALTKGATDAGGLTLEEYFGYVAATEGEGGEA